MTDENSAQALEGKDVKDLLLNVGSGGGAAAAPAAGGAPAADGAAPAEEKKEEKAEGTWILHSMSAERCGSFALLFRTRANTRSQRRKSPTTTWVSVSSIRRFSLRVSLQVSNMHGKGKARFGRMGYLLS